MRVKAKIRYSHKGADATIRMVDEDTVEVVFDEPVTPWFTMKKIMWLAVQVLLRKSINRYMKNQGVFTRVDTLFS